MFTCNIELRKVDPPRYIYFVKVTMRQNKIYTGFATYTADGSLGNFSFTNPAFRSIEEIYIEIKASIREHVNILIHRTEFRSTKVL